MVAKRVFEKTKPGKVCGQGRKTREMFRIGLHARVSTRDLYSRISFILPGSDPEDSFERFAESGVGIVTDGRCNFEQLFVTLA